MFAVQVQLGTACTRAWSGAELLQVRLPLGTPPKHSWNIMLLCSRGTIGVHCCCRACMAAIEKLLQQWQGYRPAAWAPSADDTRTSMHHIFFQSPGKSC